MSAIAFKTDENLFTRLDEVISTHVAKLPYYLQSEVYDFVLFLEQKQSTNNEHIKLTPTEQQSFVQALLNSAPANEKLQHSVQRYRQQTHE